MGNSLQNKNFSHECAIVKATVFDILLCMWATFKCNETHL